MRSHFQSLTFFHPDNGRDETAAEVDKFLNMYRSGDDDDGSNVLRIGELGHETALGILRTWQSKIRRELTNHQWRVVSNALRKCSLPLFMSLCFEETKKWKSYSPASDTAIPR